MNENLRRARNRVKSRVYAIQRKAEEPLRKRVIELEAEVRSSRAEVERLRARLETAEKVVGAFKSFLNDEQSRHAFSCRCNYCYRRKELLKILTAHDQSGTKREGG